MNFSSRGFFKFCQRGIQETVESAILSGVAGWPKSRGIYPYPGLPYRCSHKLRPSCPLEFAIPVGQCRDFEFNMMCAVSTQDAASTTTLAYTSTSFRVDLSTYATPFA